MKIVSVLLHIYSLENGVGMRTCAYIVICVVNVTVRFI